MKLKRMQWCGFVSLFTASSFALRATRSKEPLSEPVLFFEILQYNAVLARHSMILNSMDIQPLPACTVGFDGDPFLGGWFWIQARNL